MTTEAWVLWQKYLKKQYSTAVPFVVFANSSQCFWQNDTWDSWGDRGSKWDLLLDKHPGISSYSCWGRGLANEHFLLQLVIIFFAFSINTDVSFLLFSCAGLPMTYGYLIFNIMRSSKRIFTGRYQTCHTATPICQDWAMIINVDPHTVRIFITACLWNDKSFDQA